MNWKEWFKEHISVAFFGMSITHPVGSDCIAGMSSYQYSDHTEEMYQAFKARLCEELSLGVQVKNLRPQTDYEATIYLHEHEKK
jgi:hypothetical protein